MDDTGSASTHYLPGFNKHVATLTPSQRAFPCLLHAYLQQPTRTLIMVAGGPGSGKTYTVTGCLDQVQVTQLRMAPTARVASKMKGNTIHSTLKLDWTPGSVLNQLEKELMSESDEAKCLDKSKVLLKEFDCRFKPQIVIIDEIGMVPFWLAYWIIQYFFQYPILIVVMGDPNQLRPVKSKHNVFSANIQLDLQRIDLVESKRFTEPYAKIIARLRQYVDANDESGMMGYLCKEFPIVEEIDRDILIKCTRAMAYLKDKVKYYNKFYLRHLVKGPLVRLWSAKNHSCVAVKVGCLIFVDQNGVSTALNGTPLIFDRHDAQSDSVYCKDLVNHKDVQVNRNTRGEFPISVGFAGTVHKFQGDTMDDTAIAINFNGNTNLHLIYTALSRVRSMDQIVAIEL